MLELLALCRVACALSHIRTHLFEVSLFNKMDACYSILITTPGDVMTDVGDKLTTTALDPCAVSPPTEPVAINDHVNAVLVTAVCVAWRMVRRCAWNASRSALD